MRLGRTDLEGALGFVHEAWEVDGKQPFPSGLLQRLASLVGCHGIAYAEIDRTRRRLLHMATSDPEREEGPEVAAAFWATAHQNPLRIHRNRTGDLSALKLYDVVTPRQLRTTQYYADYVRPYATPFWMGFGLPAPRGTTRTFTLSREARDFGERERTLLNLLRPHLVQIRRAAEARSQARQMLALTSTNLLTERETEILGWVAEGLTNRAIAEVLWISPGTVRRHLDNIYAKLDVHTRTAAVRSAYERGSLPPQGGI